MKQSFVRGVAGLLVVGTLAYVFFGSTTPSISFPSFRSGSSLERFVPGVYDQILYLSVDDDLKAVALQSNQFVDDGTFSSIIDTLDEVIVYQMLDYDSLSAYSLIFMQGNSGFSIDQIEAFGLLAGDEGFSHRDLGDDRWVYGDSASLARLDSHNQGLLVDDAGWKGFKSTFGAGAYNAGFLSAAVNPDPTNLLANQFVEKLQYTYAVSAMSLENPSGKVVLQLADETITGSIGSLQPRVVTALSENPLLYFETENILSLFSVDPQELTLLLPALLGQFGPSIGVAFDNSDVERIAEALAGNISIVAVPSLESPIQAGVHLLFDNPELYDTLVKFAPVLSELLGAMIVLPTDQVEIVPEISENAMSYSVVTGPVALSEEEMDALGMSEEDRALLGTMPTSFPLFSFRKNDDAAVVSFFAAEQLSLDGSFSDHYPISAQTKALFGFDAGLLQQTLGGGLGGAGDVLFSDGILQGALNVDTSKQQVILDFIVQ